MSMSNTKLTTIHPQDFRDLQKPFNITLDEKYLYEKHSNKIGDK